uniref:Uncharacterized protein n=1 Tax=Helianthus annuus TaxID=4232 RepID=A0A251T534_HELAN
MSLGYCHKHNHPNTQQRKNDHLQLQDQLLSVDEAKLLAVVDKARSTLPNRGNKVVAWRNN